MSKTESEWAELKEQTESKRNPKETHSSIGIDFGNGDRLTARVHPPSAGVRMVVGAATPADFSLTDGSVAILLGSPDRFRVELAVEPTQCEELAGLILEAYERWKREFTLWEYEEEPD